MEHVWETVTKGEGVQDALNCAMIDRMLQKSATEPGFNETDRAAMMLSVNPMAFGRHALEVYEDFLTDNIKVPLARMGDEDFFKVHNDKAVFVCGVVLEVKTGKGKWGGRYVIVTMEDVAGVQRKISADLEGTGDLAALAEVSSGAPIIVMGLANSKWLNIKAHLFVDVETLRQKIATGQPMTLWERIMVGNHPAMTYPFKQAEERKLALRNVEEVMKEARADARKRDAPSAKFQAIGMVTHVRITKDKRGAAMAFLGVLGPAGFLDTVCFASIWEDVSGYVVPGALLRLEFERKEGSNFLMGVVKSFKRSSAPAVTQ